MIMWWFKFLINRWKRKSFIHEWHVSAHHNLWWVKATITLSISFRCVIKSNIPTKSNLFRIAANRSICHVEVMSLYILFQTHHKKNLHHCVISKRKKCQRVKYQHLFFCVQSTLFMGCVWDSTCDSCRFRACLNHPSSSCFYYWR